MNSQYQSLSLIVWIPKQFSRDSTRCKIYTIVTFIELLALVFWLDYWWIRSPLSSASLMLFLTIFPSSSTFDVYSLEDLSHCLIKSSLTQFRLFLKSFPPFVNYCTSASISCNWSDRLSSFPKNVVLPFLRPPVLAIVSPGRPSYLVLLNVLVVFLLAPNAVILDRIVWSPSSYFCYINICWSLRLLFWNMNGFRQINITSAKFYSS